jgi:hypothetical protein
VNVRIAAVSVVSAALVASGAGAAVAAPQAAPAPKASITLKSSAPSVKLGDPVTFSGKVTGLKEGSKVVIQVKEGTKWVTLPAATKVVKGTYKVAEKLEKKGKEILRAKDGNTVSKAVSVTVK